MYIIIYIHEYSNSKNSKVESNLNSADLLVYLFGVCHISKQGQYRFIAEDNESWDHNLPSHCERKSIHDIPFG